MNLYLGNNKSVDENEILGVFDLDTATVSVHTRNFLNQAEKEKKVVYINMYELPKSFVITGDKVYITPASAATLLKRTSKFSLNI